MANPHQRLFRRASDHRPNYFQADQSLVIADATFNKGSSFTEKERCLLGLRGLLPSIVESLEVQTQRCLKQFRSMETPMGKYIYLSSLKSRCTTLFYKLLVDNLTEMLPIVYTPTVGQACIDFSDNFRATEGMYFDQKDRGHMRSMLDNWKTPANKDVAIIVVTDGSRILGLGDLGICGMGIPIGKLSLYVAAGGFHPGTTLPIVLDVGTNNKNLIQDPLYLGERHERLGDDQYYALLDEMLMAIKDKWPNCLVQFEDFSNNHCFDILDKYKDRMLCFNDDIQGTGAVIAAGFLNALKLSGKKPTEHRIVFLGAGAAGVGVVTQIMHTLVHRFGITVDEARSIFYLVDSKGLVTANRGDTLASFKVPLARHDVTQQCKNLMETIKLVRPTGLVGLSGQSGAFDDEVIDAVCGMTDRPIIFPLSNPTKNSECTAEVAITRSKGKVIFASGSPFADVSFGGKVYSPSQGNNMYVFPGLGYGAWFCRAAKVSDGMINSAVEVLADSVTQEQLHRGMIYPPLTEIREISAKISAAVVMQAEQEGIAGLTPPMTDVKDLQREISQCMYVPEFLEVKEQ